MNQHLFERAGLPSAAPEILVIVEKCQEGIPSGKMINEFVEKPIAFRGFAELLLRMDALYDYLDFPQSFRKPRTFRGEAEEDYDRLRPYEKRSYTTYLHQAEGKGMLTFLVKTRFRQNGSWQGFLLWMEAGKEQHFISTLQCLKLMMEALSVTLEKERDAQ